MRNAITTLSLRAMSTFKPPQKPLVFSGAGSTLKLAEFMLLGGSKNPLIVTDEFLHENGMLDGLLDYLKTQGVAPIVFDQIVPNPTMANVEAGVKASVDGGCDAVFVVGGGSAIDTAKVIAAASTSRKGIEGLVGVLKVKEPLLPFYIVPTTSGSGSEVTTIAVISDTETHKKKFFVDPKYLPIATALDPILLKSLPAGMTAAVGMDALTHGIEAYCSANSFKETDRDAEMAVRLLVEHLPTAVKHGADETAREMVALGSFLAGFAFTKSSLGMVHAISHQISAHYDTPHGLTNAVILPRVLRFNRGVCEDKFAHLETMFDEDAKGLDANTLSWRFIDRIDALSEAIDIPVNLDMIQTEDFPAIAKEAVEEAQMAYALPRVMSRAHVTQILRSVMAGDRAIAF